MKNRCVLALWIGSLVSLSATIIPCATAASQQSELRIGLRIGATGAATMTYADSVRSALIASGTPRNAVFSALGSDVSMRGDDDEMLWRAASRASDDVLVQWLAANRLLAAHDARAASVIAALTRREPDNAVAWMLALSLAEAEQDAAGIYSALARMAASTRADDHFADAVRAWLTVYERHPRPLAAFANPAEADAAPFVDAMAKAAATALPSYQPIVAACRSATENDGVVSRADDCAAAARLMLHHATSLSARAVGFAVLRNLGDAEITPLDRAAERDLAWIAENASRVSGFADLDRVAMAANRADWLTLDDEYAIVQRAMQRAGVPAEAPPGWTPPPRLIASTAIDTPASR